MENAWPKWAAEINSRYMANVAHQFLLYGNIDDYVWSKNSAPLKMANFLETFLASWQTKWDIIVFYNLSSGLRFADDDKQKPKMKDRFYQTLGRPTPGEVEQGWNKILDRSSPATPSRESRLQREVLPLLERLLVNSSLKTAVVIEHADVLAPNGEIAMLMPEDREAIVTFARWAHSTEISRHDNLVILQAKRPFDLHPDIRDITGKTEMIEVPFPAREERKNWVEFFLKYRHTKEVECEVPNIDRITTGFNLLAMEDLWLRAKESHEPVTVEMIIEKKKEIQKAESGDLLAVIEPEEGFEQIGGLESVKEAFQEVARRLKEGDTTLPPGALLLGPPGTGKSVLARALAKAGDVPLIQFLDIQEKWVGSSERNMRRALDSLKRYDQAIVFVDEFDQAYGGRGGLGDSGVTSRLFGVLLEFMGDPKNRGKIFWLGATNRPDRIDPAMKRPGRFSQQYLFFPPDAKDRGEIFKVMFEKRHHIVHKISSFAEAVDQTEGYTGAEIEEVCTRSRDIAIKSRRKYVSNEDLLQAIEDYIPAKDPSYELMTLLAVASCTSRSAIPEKYRQMTRNELNQKILKLKAELGMQSPTVWGI